MQADNNLLEKKPKQLHANNSLLITIDTWSPVGLCEGDLLC